MELRLTPLEAYERLKRVLAEVNRLMSTFASEKFLSDADAFIAGGDEGEAAAASGGGEEEEEEMAEQDNFSFSPEKGNVAFASAMDGCGGSPRPQRHA